MGQRYVYLATMCNHWDSVWGLPVISFASLFVRIIRVLSGARLKTGFTRRDASNNAQERAAAGRAAGGPDDRGAGEAVQTVPRPERGRGALPGRGAA